MKKYGQERPSGWATHPYYFTIVGFFFGVVFASAIDFDQGREVMWDALSAIGTIVSAAAAVGLGWWGVQAARRTQKREWLNNERVRHREIRRTQMAVQAALAIEMKEICEVFDTVLQDLYVQISNYDTFPQIMDADIATRLREMVERERFVFSRLVDQIGGLEGNLALAVWGFYSQHLYAKSFFLRMVDIASDRAQMKDLARHYSDMKTHSARLWLRWELFRCRASIDIDAEHGFREKMTELVPDLKHTGGEGEHWADQASTYIGGGG